jgi:hypothetical protein
MTTAPAGAIVRIVLREDQGAGRMVATCVAM